jgi:hypothetical protein
MELKVTMGDWSNDGHGITEVVIVELPTIMSVIEFNRFYKVGASIAGFDLKEDVARNYEDSTIEMELYEKILELGYNPYEFKRSSGMFDDLPYRGEDSNVYINPELYLDLYMFFVALGYKEVIGSNDSFAYSIVSDSMERVTIGGYGLFY